MDSGSGKQSKRTRPQLDRDVILAAALELAKSPTADAVTVRKLGAALGADPTAIYRHFRNKDELVAAILDRIFATGIAHLPPTSDWRADLRDMARALFEELRAYPSIGVLASGVTTNGGGELAGVERILANFRRAGLSPADTVRFYGVFANHVLATSAAAANLVLLAPERADATTAWLGDVGSVDASTYPTVASLRIELAVLRDEDIFYEGVDVILDAAAARAQEAANRP